jgi:GDPmannose 4,6-dehydratase
MKKVAVITGITGQDGSYLAELLLEKDYQVFGLKRRTSSNGLGCSTHLQGHIEVVEGDVMDPPSLAKIVKLARPHEFYNLAAQSHVGTSFDQPCYTAQSTGMGALNCLEAIRQSGLHTRFYQASTSELFGGQSDAPYNETSPFHPRSPYGSAKLFAHWTTVNYRESYRMFACNGILFNHESPRRGPNFVTRKITLGIGDIHQGKAKKVRLGNLDASRDWGHAKDYVRGMWMMLQHSDPMDFVLATGKAHSVRDFCDVAFRVSETGNYNEYVEVDPQFYRPAEVHTLLGDFTKARLILGWEPIISFEALVKEMVEADTSPF